MGDVPEEAVGFLPSWRQFQRSGGEEAAVWARGCGLLQEQDQETLLPTPYAE